MRLGIYTQASTANPTGRRPWNSRLAFYVPNTFGLPTAGRGPFLLQPGAIGRPMQNGGVPGAMTPDIAAAATPSAAQVATASSLISTVSPALAGLGCDGCAKSMAMAGINFPNYAGFQRPRSSRRRFDSAAPQPFYSPVSAVTSQLSGFGQDESTQILGTSVDPTLLAVGVGLLFVAVYFLGSGRPRRKRRRLQRKISRTQAQLRAIEAA